MSIRGRGSEWDNDIVPVACKPGVCGGCNRAFTPKVTNQFFCWYCRGGFVEGLHGFAIPIKEQSIQVQERG